MRKILIGLVLLGAMILPAQAAAEVSPQTQAMLDQHGWTITNDDAAVPMTTVAKSCPNARARRAGSAIRDYADRIMVFGRIGLRVGAANGRIILCGRGSANGSPGYRWSNVWGPDTEVRRPCCGGRHLWLVYKQEWVYRSQTLDQYWNLTLQIRAHVRSGTNQIWFDVRRVWV